MPNPQPNDQLTEFRKKQGKLLKKARKNCGSKFSQSLVGEKLGLSQDAISKMETGEQPIDSYRLLEFAKLYERPVTFFYMVNLEEVNR